MWTIYIQCSFKVHKASIWTNWSKQQVVQGYVIFLLPNLTRYFSEQTNWSMKLNGSHFRITQEIRSSCWLNHTRLTTFACSNEKNCFSDLNDKLCNTSIVSYIFQECIAAGATPTVSLTYYGQITLYSKQLLSTLSTLMCSRKFIETTCFCTIWHFCPLWFRELIAF